jgi:hypothetical protein
MLINLQVGNDEILGLDLLTFPVWFAQNSFYYDSFEVIFSLFLYNPIYLMCLWNSVMEHNTFK